MSRPIIEQALAREKNRNYWKGSVATHEPYANWCTCVRDYTARYVVRTLRDQADVVFFECQIFCGTMPTVYVGRGDTFEAAFKRMQFYAQKKNFKRFEEIKITHTSQTLCR